jgi:mismatch-specific thymine-DNA glycosylase
MRKSFDRFHGVSEEEIYKKELNDVVNFNLDIIFVNINPGLYSVFKGHHYSGPGNHFCKFFIFLKFTMRKKVMH